MWSPTAIDGQIIGRGEFSHLPDKKRIRKSDHEILKTSCSSCISDPICESLTK